MAKAFHVNDILTRLIDARPEFETYEGFSRRIGLHTCLTIVMLNKRNDIAVSTAYLIAKAFGYQIMFYNPNPPEGLEKCYVVGTERNMIVPREKRKRYVYHKDPFTKEIYREKRKYKFKRKNKFIKVG